MSPVPRRSWVNNYLMTVTLLVAFALMQWWRAVAICIAPWVVLSVWPEVHATRPKWGHRLGAWIMRRAREYFHLTVVLEDNDTLSKAMEKSAVIGLEARASSQSPRPCGRAVSSLRARAEHSEI